MNLTLNFCKKDLETAQEMLELLFESQRETSFVKEFNRFLQIQSEYKAINKDQWNNFLDFCFSTTPDLSDYDMTGSCKFFF